VGAAEITRGLLVPFAPCRPLRVGRLDRAPTRASPLACSRPAHARPP